MYIPRANQEDRLPVLHQLMLSHPLASLITVGSSGLFASHLPIVLEPNVPEPNVPDPNLPKPTGGLGILKCHVSRANAQWRDHNPAVQALAIFSGPQHYITPTWYPEKQETGKVVPTWNYVVVHAYGFLKVIEDPQWLRAHLETLVTIHEAALPVPSSPAPQSQAPWKISDAPADYISSQIKGIVGFEIAIDRLEGKWKVSQNRPEQDRAGVVTGLAALNTPASLSMKALVEKRD